MAIVIRMPEVLAGAAEAALQAWLVRSGDKIAIGQPIAEVETEKATVEYEAESEGTLAGTLIDVGVQVPVGTPIAVLAEAGESAEQALAAAAVADAEATVADGQAEDNAMGPGSELGPPSAGGSSAAAVTVQPSAVPAAHADAPAAEGAAETRVAQDQRRLFASPLVRRIAREKGLDLSAVRGSGPGGRIVRRDIENLDAAARPAFASRPRNTTTTSGYTEIPHTGMRRAIARRLLESKTTVPHYYLTADCLVDDLLALRRRINQAAASQAAALKVSVNDLVVKAVAAAFRDVPEANAIWTDAAVRRFEDVDIAVAVAVDGGLVTPVVRAVDKRSLTDVAAAIRDLADRGRAGRLKQDELEGGAFSVSNLGMYGTREFSAIINPPHSGILAVGAAEQRPVAIDGELQVRTVMTVTLSADHRVLDGALAAEWLAAFVAKIENPVAILL